MSEQPLGPDWWQASNGRWYAPEQWTGPPGSRPPAAAGGGATLQTAGRQYSGSLSVELPDGWFAKETIALLAPDGQANVIVMSEPLDPRTDAATYAANQGERLRVFAKYEEHSFEPVTVLGDKSGFVRRFSWTPPDGERVYQVEIYYAWDGRGYTATATTPATQQHRYDAVLRTVLSSLRLR